MRRHPDTNAVLTFPVRRHDTGEQVLVDDRTFDRAKHEPLHEEDAPDYVPGAPVEDEPAETQADGDAPATPRRRKRREG